MKINNVLITAVLIGLAGMAFAAPATLTQSVSDGSETITLRMTLESARGSNFEVLVQNSSGTYDVHTAADVATYIGTVDEYPSAITAGILKSNGDLWTKVYFDRGYTWFTLGSAKYGERGDMEAFLHMPTLDNLQPGHVGITTYLWDQAVDMSWKHFSQLSESNVTTCLEQAEFMAMQLKAIYLRDALVIPGLARVVIRGSQAHCPYETSASLTAVKTEWETNHARPGVDYDTVAMSYPGFGGGVAWLGTIGVGNSYSANGADSDGSFDIVGRHEIGHNWGVYDNHANNSEGHTINCGNAFGRFSGPEVEAILDQRDAKISYLDSQGTYNTIDVPPYAGLDSTIVVIDSTSSMTIDVLANDHDANGDSISVNHFDSVSANGAVVSLSSETGPGGRDEITYTLGNEIGMDHFYYTIIDSSGKTATGLVLVYTDLDNVMKGYWPLDETSGTTAHDLTLYSNDAALTGGVTFDTESVAGRFGKALYFDGVDDAVSMDEFQVNGNTVTMSAWVKRDGAQVDWAGLFMSRSGATAGFDMRDTNELRYNWTGSDYNVPTGLYLPDNQWVFVALVIEPTKATVYMHDGTLQSFVNNGVSHDVHTITSAHLGDDYGYRYFQGAIDDARIYDYSLTQSEIEAIIAGGVAGDPSPYDGKIDVKTGYLQWVPSTTATGYDVYVGTSLAAVAAATKASPEFMEAITFPSFSATLSDTTQYYWRIDTVTSSATVTGAVWSFTTGVLQPVVINPISWSNSGGTIDYDFDKVIDNSGLSESLNTGDPLPVSLPTHTLPGFGSSFESVAGRFTGLASGSATLVFDLGATNTLDSCLFWNGGEYWGGSYYNDRSVAGMTLSFSTDGVNFSGDMPVSPARLADTTVPFAPEVFAIPDIDARYVKLSNISNHNGNDAHTAISEIKFTYTTPPDADGDGIPDATDPDDDNDGMTDVWEIAHSLDPFVDDKSGNPDFDAYDNWSEYVMDTLPRDGGSYQTFSIELAPDSDEVIVRFGTSASRRYAVEYRFDLTSGTWLSNPVFSGNGLEMTVPFASVSNCYYRLRVELP